MKLGFFGLLCITFIVLKLAHIISWSWWLVFAPIWGAFLLFFLFFGGFITLLALIFGDAVPKKRGKRGR